MSRAERHAVRINVSFVFIYTIVRFCLRIFMCKNVKVREAESNRGMLKGRKRERERKGERATHCRQKCFNCVQRVKIVSVLVHSCHHGLRMWHRERPDRHRSAFDKLKIHCHICYVIHDLLKKKEYNVIYSHFRRND